MKIAIIGGLSTDQNAQTDYKGAFEAKFPDSQFDVIRFDYLTFEVAPNKFEVYDGRSNTPLSSYDCLIFRGNIRSYVECAFVVSRYALYKKIRFFNDYSNYRPSSKLAQAVTFFELGVPQLPTYYSMNTDYLVAITTANLTYPLIVKDSFGAHGRNNFVAKDGDEFAKILKDNPSVKFITQGFCPNDCDYRILVIGDKKPLIIKRTAAEGTHLNNTSQGGSAELKAELPQNILADAQKIAKELKMIIAGVDALQNKDTGEYYFLEVNSQPQLVSGAFVEEKLDLFSQFLNQ